MCNDNALRQQLLPHNNNKENGRMCWWWRHVVTRIKVISYFLTCKHVFRMCWWWPHVVTRRSSSSCKAVTKSLFSSTTFRRLLKKLSSTYVSPYYIRTTYVSAYYICVLVLLYVCPNTTICVCILADELLVALGMLLLRALNTCYRHAASASP